ncbi:MAG: DUF167 domain-containing protein [Candidatus Bathyarchaeota archaeon]|jgi:uncharacterized protein (TIGR00251 family)|nr:MAG: DUF167 domain-containing protein [Candidatus Bathyarchaeota archaeon]
MKPQGTVQGTTINVYVKPNSRQFQVMIKDDVYIVYCREAPVKGKVNRELIKELSRLFGKKVEILSGLTSRNKKILVKNADEAYLSTFKSALS